jgi:hypothetical protein
MLFGLAITLRLRSASPRNLLMTTPARRSSRFQAREATAVLKVGEKRKRTLSDDEEEYPPQAEVPIGGPGGTKALKKTRLPESTTYVIPDVLKKETTFKGRLGA